MTLRDGDAVAGPLPAFLDWYARLVDAGKLRPVIDSRFPLARAAAAHVRLESGAAIGKVLVEISAR